MTDETKKTDESPDESLAVPAPSAQVIQETGPMIHISQIPTLTDRDLDVHELWVEMGRMTEAVFEMQRTGNMVKLDHASMELAQLWRLLDKRKVLSEKGLVFKDPVDSFEDGMSELLGVEELAPQLEEDKPADILKIGDWHLCPACSTRKEIPGVGVYSEHNEKIEGMFTPMRGENENVDDLVCPNCGFVVGHHYASKLYWERSSFVPDEEQLAAGSIEHHIWSRIERLEAHIKAVEASIPAIVQTTLRKAIQESRADAEVLEDEKSRLIRQFFEVVDRERLKRDWINIGTDTLGYVADELRRLMEEKDGTARTGAHLRGDEEAGRGGPASDQRAEEGEREPQEEDRGGDGAEA